MKKLLTTLFSFYIISLFGQSVEYPYDFTVFPTLEDNYQQTDKFLKNGGNAFILSIEEKNENIYLSNSNGLTTFYSLLSKISNHKKKQPNSLFTLIIKGKTSTNLLINDFKRLGLENEIYYSTIGEWLKPTDIIKKGKHFIVFTETRLKKPFLQLYEKCSQTSYNKIKSSNDYESWFSNNPSNSFVIYHPYYQVNRTDKLFKNIPLSEQKCTALYSAKYLWARTGKVPNFLICDINRLNECIDAAKSINSMYKHLFNLQWANLPLNEVYWRNRDSLITSGSFSIPDYGQGTRMEPYKDNFIFSPDVFEASGINSYEIKKFLCTKIEDDNASLLLMFDFTKKRFFPNEKDFKYTNTSFVDSGLSLNGKISFIDCENICIIDSTKPISISAKIFPRKFDSYRIIVSKNFSFALKLYDEYITFTTPVVPGVRDYYALTKGLEKNKWSHIVVIFRPRNHISFYLNGELIETQKTFGYQPSKNSLMIGANERGRYFDGTIQNVIIWNRAISKDEVANLYNGSHPIYEKKNPLSYWWILLFPLLFIAILSLKKKQKTSLVAKPFSGNYSTLATKKAPEVHFFGDIAILDADGNNKIAMFPPKILQLFILIACNSTTYKNGITSNDITRLLWEDYESEKAKNNRKYSLAKLKQIIDEIDFIELEQENKCWKIVFLPNTRFDFQEYESFVSEFSLLSVHKLTQVLPLFKKGAFLNTQHSECFDALKASVSNQIIDILLSAANHPLVKSDTRLSNEIAETIFLYDEVNEDAHAILIRSLLAEGKNSLALKAYERFKKRYSELFGEEYKTSFKNMCKE